jgi:type IX secretion system substrate protein
MKKIIFVLSIAVQTATAQITLEHNYPNAFSPGTTGNFDNADFGITWLTPTDTKYYLVNYTDTTLTLYNMNHSLFLNITLPVAQTNGLSFSVSYITAGLFDCDTTTIEYLIDQVDFTGTNYFVRVYRTNGTQLINISGGFLDNCIHCGGMKSLGITNTPSGTKMLVGLLNGSESVYSLCGSLPSGFNDLSVSNSTASFVNAFPNPASDYAVIEYELPAGERTGEIIFYDMTGKEMKRFTVDHTFNNLRISTSDIPAGTYIYVLQTRKGISGSRRMVKIN